MTILSALWARIAPYALGVLGILAAVLTFGWSQRRAGKAEAKAEATTRTLEIKDAQQQAAARAPVDRDGVVDRLRNGTF